MLEAVRQRDQNPSVWASGNSPGTGTFSLAEIALRTALSDSLFQAELNPAAKDRESRSVILNTSLTPAAILSQLVQGDSEATDSEAAD